MANTTYGGIGNRTAGYAARKMLEHAKPHIVLGNLGDQKPLPKNKTKVIKFRRRVAYATTEGTALTEGTTPTAVAFSYDDVQATLAQYGNLSIITDHVADTSEDPVLQDATMMMGENLAATSEQVCYDVVKAATNEFFTSTATQTNEVNDPIDDAAIDAMVRNLQGSKAMKITPRVSASTKIATEGIAPAYVAVGHTDLEYDIRALTGFVPVEKYGSHQPISMHELGKRNQVRFLLSADLAAEADAGGLENGMISTTGTSADVYQLLMFGEHAFGHVPLSGADSVTPIVIGAGTPTKSDPLAQRGYVGWKRWYTCLILNQAWMARLECAATDL